MAELDINEQLKAMFDMESLFQLEKPKMIPWINGTYVPAFPDSLTKHWQHPETSCAEVSDDTARRLRSETFSQRMARIRSEKATPAERASAEAAAEQREREQRIERLKLEIEAGKAASDIFYEP